MYYTSMKNWYTISMLKKIVYFILPFLLIIAVLLVLANATNPYSSPTLIESPYITNVNKGEQIDLFKVKQATYSKNIFVDGFANLNKNVRFVYFLFFPEKAVQGDEKMIIRSIHARSFDPQRPYIISGSHFADIYIRNLGIFYNAVLDNRFALDKTDWENRQRIYLQGLALNIELHTLAGRSYTTWVPVTGTTYTSANVYTEPSDSLFGVLYGLKASTDDNFISGIYDSNARPLYPLQTKGAANDLLKTYRKGMNPIIINYYLSVIDPQTGLVRKEITLSSARDGIRRQSSFYDNVIVWATMKYASDLGIIDKKIDFGVWKKKIITAFWDEEGLFLDDLSQESRQEKLFSGDAFIVIGSGFFDLTNAADKERLAKMVVYVQKNNLDSPFPLRYARQDQPDRLYDAVKYFAPSYMGETIWSHWGMEYIKALILLSSDKPSYKELAKKHLDAYKAKMEQYGGYPELYDKDGNIYKTMFYTSVLQTSWVVNYEQARMMIGE